MAFPRRAVTRAGQKIAFEDRAQEVVEAHDIEIVVLAR